ncbi:MAG: hypothetical protein U1B83_06885, partial [Candidatus Cloacimonadaceae bacterium]|nr:hypothetical protein [Candidatus Cloacimonadaceae bacterium]
MKSYLSIVLLLLFSLSFALPIKAPDSSPKMFHLALHNAGSLSMETSNLGFSENLVYSQAGIKFLFKGAPWISGKRPRRNDQGSLLYWLSDNPHANPETVTADDPLWHAGLKVVIDSLTTVGYDGDRDLYEFLPAYNPLCSANPGVPYAQYNTSDVVLKSILGSPAPRPFAVPDPLGNYCFTSNQGGTFETPGFETLSAYYYDYCPFGTTGDRDWGIYRGLST